MKTENRIRTDIYPAPLNDSQMGVYLNQMNDIGNTKYNIPVIRFYENDIQQISHDFVCPFHLSQAPLFMRPLFPCSAVR